MTKTRASPGEQVCEEATQKRKAQIVEDMTGQAGWSFPAEVYIELETGSLHETCSVSCVQEATRIHCHSKFQIACAARSACKTHENIVTAVGNVPQAPKKSKTLTCSQYGFAHDEVANPNVEDARVAHTAVTSLWADGTRGPLLMVLPPGHYIRKLMPCAAKFCGGTSPRCFSARRGSILTSLGVVVFQIKNAFRFLTIGCCVLASVRKPLNHRSENHDTHTHRFCNTSCCIFIYIYTYFLFFQVLSPCAQERSASRGSTP